MKKLATLIALAVSYMVATAGPISVMVGDADGFGGAFPDLTLPQDNRSVAEAVATDGSQQTDFYSTLFNPLPETFSMNFTFSGTVSSLALSFRSFGLQSAVLGPFGATANGIDISSAITFEDGPFADATHSTDLDAAVLASINATHALNITFNRNGSNDAVAFDFFQLTGRSTDIPEPATLALLGGALLAMARRRRQAAR